MTLTQLRCLCAVVDQGLHISRAAGVLHTTQPAVTKMIRTMEQELGVEILVRSGPRIIAVTQSGQEVVNRARQVLLEVNNLKLAASDSGSQPTGSLRIAGTPLCAKHILCDKIRDFTRRFPHVDLSLSVSRTEDVIHWTSSGEVDLGIGTMPVFTPANLIRIDAYSISRCIVAQAGHPILKKRKPTIIDIGNYPLITHQSGSTTGELVKRAFANAGITPKVVVTVNSDEIVKTYVAAGMGIAIMQSIAITNQDQSIRAVNVDHLFPPSNGCIVLRRDQYLRSFMYEFISMISPKSTRDQVDRARRKGGIKSV